MGKLHKTESILVSLVLYNLLFAQDDSNHTVRNIGVYDDRYQRSP